MTGYRSRVIAAGCQLWDVVCQQNEFLKRRLKSDEIERKENNGGLRIRRSNIGS